MHKNSNKTMRIEFLFSTEFINDLVLYFEFDSKYKQFVVNDICDSFKVAILFSAIKAGYKKIYSKYTISAKLYYNLAYHVIPQVSNNMHFENRIILDMPTIQSTWHGPLVAMRMSRGVDSFATLFEYEECSIEEYRINTLMYFCVGANHGNDVLCKIRFKTNQQLFEN